MRQDGGYRAVKVDSGGWAPFKGFCLELTRKDSSKEREKLGQPKVNARLTSRLLSAGNTSFHFFFSRFLSCGFDFGILN